MICHQMGHESAGRTPIRHILNARLARYGPKPPETAGASAHILMLTKL